MCMGTSRSRRPPHSYRFSNSGVPASHLCHKRNTGGGHRTTGSSMNRLRTAFVAILVLGIVGVAEFLAAPPVAAHTHVRQGEYELTVGWRVEPAIVGSLNGLDLGIQDHLANGTVVRVEGVESNLTATLKTGP